MQYTAIQENTDIYTPGVVSQQFVTERYTCTNTWKSQSDRRRLSWGAGVLEGDVVQRASVRAASVRREGALVQGGVVCPDTGCMVGRLCEANKLWAWSGSLKNVGWRECKRRTVMSEMRWMRGRLISSRLANTTGSWAVMATESVEKNSSIDVLIAIVWHHWKDLSNTRRISNRTHRLHFKNRAKLNIDNL